jgi:hypothetical protein
MTTRLGKVLPTTTTANSVGTHTHKLLASLLYLEKTKILVFSILFMYLFIYFAVLGFELHAYT